MNNMDILYFNLVPLLCIFPSKECCECLTNFLLVVFKFRSFFTNISTPLAVGINHFQFSVKQTDCFVNDIDKTKQETIIFKTTIFEKDRFFISKNAEVFFISKNANVFLVFDFLICLNFIEKCAILDKKNPGN